MSEPDPAAEALSLTPLTAALVEAEALLRAIPYADADDLAEGYRHLLGLLSATIRRVSMGSDPDRPRFVLLADDFTRGVFTNPDSHVVAAEIAAGRSYVIRGERGACADITFEILDGLVGYDARPVHSFASLDTPQIDFAADGRYEVRLGGEPGGSNWLPLPEGATTLFARLTLADWLHGSAPYPVIECIDGALPVSEGRPLRVAATIEEISRRLVDRVRATEAVAHQWRAKQPLNFLPAPAVMIEAGYRPSQFNTACRFSLPDQHILLVETEAVVGSYSSIVAGSQSWFEAFDFREAQSSLTDRQAHLSCDGIYRYVIGPDDPGVPNWIDTDGRREGVLLLRWQGVQGKAPAQPVVRLLPATEVRRFYPENEQAVSAADRLLSLARRRALVDRRFF